MDRTMPHSVITLPRNHAPAETFPHGGNASKNANRIAQTWQDKRVTACSYSVPKPELSNDFISTASEDSAPFAGMHPIIHAIHTYTKTSVHTYIHTCIQTIHTYIPS